MQNNLVVTAGSFAFTYPSTMLLLLKSHVQSGQSLTHYFTRGKLDVEQKRYQSLLNTRGRIGVICISTRPDPESLAGLTQAGIPVVLIDEFMSGASSVAVDNFRGGYLVGEHLAKIGRKKFAVICGDRAKAGGYNAIQRVMGFRKALLEAGLSLSDDNIVEVTDYSYGEGQATMNKWLSERLDMDAIFSAAGDDCATGVLSIAQEQGVKVPSDLALVGFDDLRSSQFATPALTTVRQPMEEIASIAYELASDPRGAILHAPREEVLAPTLIIRDSAL